MFRRTVLLFAMIAIHILPGWLGFTVIVHAFHFGWDQGHDTFQPRLPADQDNPPSGRNRGCDGDPVDLGSGNFVRSERDFSIPGVGPALALVRIYHSQDRSNGPFGHGWHSNLTQRAIAVTDGMDTFVIVRLGDGRRLRFIARSDGTFQSPPGTFQRLVGNQDGSLTLIERDGTTSEFDRSGRLSRIVDRNGNALTLAYDETGFIRSVTDGGQRSLTFTRGPSGRVTAVTDPMGRSFTYAYDETGNLVSVTDPAGNTGTYSYDANHNLLSVTDPRGNTVVTNRYDGEDRVTIQTLPTGSFLFAYLAPNRTRVRDPRGNFTVYELNECCGNPTVVADPLGRIVRRTWDSDFNLTSFSDGNGHTTTFSYDEMGNLLERTNPLGARTTFTYEPTFNQVISITDPQGNRTEFSYDARGNPVAITDALGNSTSIAYDSRGLVTSIQDTLGNSTAFAYDTHGNLITTTDALGNTNSFENDALGNVLSSTDAEGRVTTFQYDAMNRLVQLTDAVAGITRYGYDANGNLTQVTDAKGQVRRFTYDVRNRLLETIDPLSRSEVFFYDANNNLFSSRDRNGRTITFTYDVANQLIRKTLPGSQVTQFTYDAAGNLTSVTDPDSALTFTYDAANQVISASTAGSPSQPDVALAYTYDSVGNRISMTDPTGTTNYTYDQLNRLTSITNPSGQTVSFNYDALSRRNRLTLPNGVTTSYSYDNASQLLSVIHQIGSTTLSSFSYTYDRAGSRTTLNQQRSAVAATRTLNYLYDPLNRLVQATHPVPGQPAETFQYDPVGNRLLRDGQTTAARFDAADRLLEDEEFTYSYDSNGNLIRRVEKSSSARTSYTYDAENRLTRIDFPDGKLAEYRYDGLARRIEKEFGDAVIRYVYDNDNVAMQFDGNNNLLVRYTQSQNIDEPLITEHDFNGSGRFETTERFFYHTDALGSINEITDNTAAIARAYVYDSFGDIVTVRCDTQVFTGREATRVGLADLPNCLLTATTYNGRELDSESWLYYYRARYYEPTIGRFLQEDPIRAVINLYPYVLSNPLNRRDPLGLQSVTDIPTTTPGQVFVRQQARAGQEFFRRLAYSQSRAAIAVSVGATAGFFIGASIGLGLQGAIIGAVAGAVVASPRNAAIGAALGFSIGRPFGLQVPLAILGAISGAFFSYPVGPIELIDAAFTAEAIINEIRERNGTFCE